jgi:signal peptidase I
MVTTLKKYRLKFLTIFHNFQKKKGSVAPQDRTEMETLLRRLQGNILDKDKEASHSTLKELLQTEERIFPRTKVYRQCKSLFSNLFFIAVIVLLRQVWFEPFQIPTGSMRPTLKELDRLVVSKNQFGINVPLTPTHFFFEPEEVKRGGIITFTGENMDIDGVKTKYFYLFDGYKQYVKRLIGKPGDILYFYGGRIYGIDKEGNDISPQFRTAPFAKLEHIPFMRLDGKLRWLKNTLYVYQSSLPVARVDRTAWGSFLGRVIYTNQPSQKPIENYYDLFGFGHFGMCRIEREQDKILLKIFHHPVLQLDKTLLTKQGVGHLEHMVSSLPLEENLLKALFSNLQTSRFVVKNSIAFPFDAEGEAEKHPENRPILKGVPDGTYEFFGGQGFSIGFQGHSSELSSSHPLMQFDTERAITLINFGIEFDVRFGPNSAYVSLLPSRYIYFKDGDLWFMGKKFLDRRDTRLLQFLEGEKKRGAENKEYPGFVDNGPPLLKDGQLDKDKIRTFGLKVPEGKYFCLGDNHAVSADSRDFGFVPEGNLRGVPSFLVTPKITGVNQIDYTLFTQSRIVVLALIIGSWALWHLFLRHRKSFPVSFN